MPFLLIQQCQSTTTADIAAAAAAATATTTVFGFCLVAHFSQITPG